jgi:hypothetical protein
MPSDPRVAHLLDALAPAIEPYRSAVAATLEAVRGQLASGQSDVMSRAERLQVQLGPFAAGRIDATRLATFVDGRRSLDASARQRLQRAAAVLDGLIAAGTDLFHAAVPPGGDLRDGVAAQIATIGRAFAAARVVTAAPAGAAVTGLDEEAALGTFPFGWWSAAERKLAPPLVVTVSGADLAAGALASFVDGTQKLVLVVDGACPPAPLVRLITPGVLVMQAHDPAEIARLAAWRGAAVAALVPSMAARFVHDPSGGPEAWQRLSFEAPRESRLARLGAFTASQQAEDLRQLEALGARPAAPPAGERAAAATAEPVDRLAAWLVQQANVPAGTPGD